MKTFLTTALTILGLIGFLSLWGFLIALFPPNKIKSSITPEHYHIPFEKISFTTKDQVLLRGWFIKSPDPKAKTIILLHGYPADKGDILPSRIFLYPTYNLLFFDFRYLGESEGNYSTVGQSEVLDLLAAIQFLKSRGINEVGVWGLSMGAAVALMTAPSAPEIKALVAEASYARLELLAQRQYNFPVIGPIIGYFTRFWALLFLHMDIRKVAPVDALAKINIPVLLIHSRGDQVIPFAHGELLQQNFHHNKKVQIIFVDEGGHGQPIKNADTIIKEFFAKNLQ